MIIEPPPRKRVHSNKYVELDPAFFDERFYEIQLAFWNGLGARQIADNYNIYFTSLLRYLRRKTNVAATYIPLEKHSNLIPAIHRLDREGCDLTIMAKELGLTRTSLIGFLRVIGYKKQRKMKFINCQFTFNGVDGTTHSHCRAYEVDIAEYRKYCERLRPYFACPLPHSISFGLFLNNIDMPDEYCP